jgi:bifunctional DNA-binding transcriptional regulator/antitoxin component of YhaV-PrlF toxin-antitoxin module
MQLVTKRLLPVAVLVPLALVATAGCDIVTADLKHSAKAEWRKSYELEPGGRVEIANVNGRIKVEPSDSRTLEIVAEKSARGMTEDAARQALDRIEIKEEASSSSVRVETKLQRGGGLFDGGSGQVTYSVRVPSGADAKFSSVNGGVELHGVKGRRLDLETTNGGIVARDVSGNVEASTTNGGVDVEFAQIGDRGAKLECTNGGIKLRLPNDAKATISASVTNGGINTSGLQLETVESTRRRLEARLNGGGPPIRIEGTNGGITIGAR